MQILRSPFIALLLFGCANAGGDASATVTDALAPSNQQIYPGEIDNAKCRDLGHEPNTWGYGNCRLELEKTRPDPIAELILRN
jgi:hypothetical protein